MKEEAANAEMTGYMDPASDERTASDGRTAV